MSADETTPAPDARQRAYPGVRRQLPRWKDLRPLLGFAPPALGTENRLRRAVTIGDLRQMAKRRVPTSVFDYTDGAADDESSLRRSIALFEAAEFHGEVMRDIAHVDLSTTMLGEESAMPIALCPTGFTRMMHHEGETAVAFEANRARVPYTLSTMGTTPLEDVAALCPDSPHWFQLYVWNDRGASTELVQRAHAAGYGALVLTVDTAVSGMRRRDAHNGLTIPPKLTPSTFLDMATHPNWWANVLTTAPLEFASISHWNGTVADMVNAMFDPRVTWDDVAWLREQWPGRLVVKGIQCVEDAGRALEVGADALLLSNHGGRQIGRARPPLRLLPEVRQAYADTELFIDGGVRDGADVVTALALGADAAWIGRPYLYGLMAGGHLGVRRVLDILRAEMTRTMQLLGVTRPDQLSEKHVTLP